MAIQVPYSEEDIATLRARAEKYLQLDWKELRGLSDVEVVEIKEHEITLQAQIQENDLNLRGYAHGGVLFTMCDTASGTLVFAHDLDCVTLDASINYLRGGKPGDTITINAKAAHWGRKTIVVNVHIYNQDGEVLVSSTPTMYITGDTCSFLKEDEL